MLKIEPYIINLLLFSLGALVGVTLNYVTYKNRVIEILDNLKDVEKILDEEKYNYFVRKWTVEKKPFYVKLFEYIKKKLQERKEKRGLEHG